MLEVRGVTKWYGECRALDAVDLDSATGTVTALLGPNGAGKTTLVSIVAGLRSADEGRVVVDGVDTSRDRRAASARIGLAPQELGIYPGHRVYENLQYFAELHGVSRREVGGRIEEVASALGLTELLGRRAGALSGGQKRRLHTAMALLHRPSVLLLDEPTVGADVEARRALLAAVRNLAANGSTVLYTTHYLAEVEELDCAVAVIDQGRIVERGSVSDLVRRFASPYVQLEFDESTDMDRLPWASAVIDGRRVRLPGADTEAVLAAMNGLRSHVTSMQRSPGGLESAYLAIVGTGGEED